MNFLKYINIHIYVSGISAKKEKSDNFPDAAAQRLNNAITRYDNFRILPQGSPAT